MKSRISKNKGKNHHLHHFNQNILLRFILHDNDTDYISMIFIKKYLKFLFEQL